MRKNLLLIFAIFLAIVTTSTNILANSIDNVDSSILDKELVEFKNKVNQDIISSFSLHLNRFEEVEDNYMMDDYSLRMIYLDILSNQEIGDVFPTIFTSSKDKLIYILEKKFDGTNNLYTLKKDKENEWYIYSKGSKKSLYIEPVGIKKPNK